MTQLCRNNLKDMLGNGLSTLKSRHPHPGLLLAKGMTELPDGSANGESKAGEIKSRLIDNVAALGPSPFYQAAFERWQAATQDATRFATLTAALAGRLYIGVVRDNALETGVTTFHTYGMPMIPGSSVKGLCRACAGDWLNHPEACRWMFGNDPGTDDDQAETGGLIFHDAWWVPSGKPFVPETVTVHHSAYYNEGAAPATDFDSPIPAPQIAVRGSFYFCIEGDKDWAAVAKQLLAKGLQQRGIGSKRSSGYGFMQT